VSSPPNATRRAFLSGDLLTRAGRQAARRLEQPWGPRPPWLAAIVRGGACVDCDQPCREACKPALIHFHPEEHAQAGTPYLRFDDTGCNFCGDCVNACPETVRVPAGKPRLGLARVDQGRCLPWRQVICINCKGRCPEDAIVWDERSRPAVSVDRCNGCGACVGACPPGALSVEAIL